MGVIGLRGGSRRMREISLFVTFLFFLFFVSSPRLQVTTVDRFSQSIHQTTRFRARKCLWGSRWWIFTFTPFSPQKCENLHYGLWQPQTAITLAKIEARSLHQSGGFRVGQFNAVIQICLRLTLVTIATNWCFLNTKLTKTQLIQEIAPRMLHQTGGFQGQAI